ncbi:MAG TPA: hypothetical protein VJL81_10175 [Solirubrobacterales bacterium]|nr:hypothetical protein [Solirubrobacterales bacterium]
MGVVSGRIGGLVARLARRHEGRARETFAAALERAVGEVDGPWRRGGAAVAVDRPAVAEAAPLLLQVAMRLRAPLPFPVEAMRLVRSLVTDGAGPLYARSAHRSEYPPGTLIVEARTILRICDRHLQAMEPHELVRS